MISDSAALMKRSHLSLTLSMITCLILLINLSFKIIVVEGFIFSATSVLCPLTAILYTLILKDCDADQQRHALNQSFLALYLFSVGIYLLVNLPAAEYMHDNPAYQIAFEDIPKKFFAGTLSFGLSFYLPHVYCCARKKSLLNDPEKRILLALLGGFFFFTLDFLLLFSHPAMIRFGQIYWGSLVVSTGILLCALALFFTCLRFKKTGNTSINREIGPAYLSVPLYHYLVCTSVTIVLICLACEYRLIAFSNGVVLGASGILFPVTIMASNLIGELFGYKANFRLALVLILSELIFDLFIMGAMALPAPDFFNLNPFYSYIMPRRILASVTALFVTFVGNAMLLENLKYTKLGLNWVSRILIANITVMSLLCLVNYVLLYVGVYPYEQIFNIAFNSWAYKMLMILVSLPVLLWLNRRVKVQLESRRPNVISRLE
ncbi:MAG: VUT family protein [Tatlockia sp.]|jgi:hypothetical protein